MPVKRGGSRGAGAPKPKKPSRRASERQRKPAKPKASAQRVEKVRVVIAMDVYEPTKDAIKAPFKEHGMKWVFLGEGKGLYKRDKDVLCFTQFENDGVHYSLWGENKKAVAEILASWERTLGPVEWAKSRSSGVEAAAEERREQESEALRLWRLAEPRRREGEPEFFFKKRVADWKTQKPA